MSEDIQLIFVFIFVQNVHAKRCFLVVNIATHFASVDKKGRKKEAIRFAVSLLFYRSSINHL